MTGRLLNLSLRAVTLLSKFALIFMLAKFLPPSVFALYGLLAVTISYALFLVGMDFYTYTTREILKQDKWDIGGKLKSQAALSVLLYAVFLPLLMLIFAIGLLPWSLAPWFVTLVVVEHVTQELSRLLVALSLPLASGVVQFCRGGLWPLFVIAAMWLYPAEATLTLVLFAWLAGGVLALFIGLLCVVRLKLRGWTNQVDWIWIRRGIRVAFPLLVATLALRGLLTVDRYLFEAFMDLDVLAAYVLFTGFCGALLSFLDAGVFIYSYPKLIAAFEDQRPSEFRRHTVRLLVNTVLVSIAFSAAAFLLMTPLLAWLDQPLYFDNQGLFPIILLVTVLNALGLIPHYALYAQHRDRPIIVSDLLGFAVFLLAAIGLAGVSPRDAVPLALGAAFLVILVGKILAYMHCTPGEYRIISRA